MVFIFHSLFIRFFAKSTSGRSPISHSARSTTESIVAQIRKNLNRPYKIWKEKPGAFCAGRPDKEKSPPQFLTVDLWWTIQDLNL